MIKRHETKSEKERDNLNLELIALCEKHQVELIAKIDNLGRPMIFIRFNCDDEDFDHFTCSRVDCEDVWYEMKI